MTGIRLFKFHEIWEDCIGMVLGAVIILTSWVTGDPVSQAAGANAAIVGLFVMALGAAEFVDLRRWEEGLETACGLWMMASPFIFGYAGSGTLRFWHVFLGACVILISLLELRQDWDVSSAELAHHSVR